MSTRIKMEYTKRNSCTYLILLTSLVGVLVPTAFGQRYTVVSSVPSDLSSSEAAEYTCLFRNNWTVANHPALYPGADARWSAPVLVTHDGTIQLWAPGGFAAPGIQSIAETGATETLFAELVQVGTSVGSSTVGTAMRNSEQQQQTIGSFIADSEHMVLSSIARIVPSPDWFTGFYDFSLLDGNTNTWLTSFTIATFPFDAGTETGERYVVMNDPEDPFLVIDEFTARNPPTTGVFLSPDGDTVLPVARWQCTLTTTETGPVVPVTPAPVPAPITTAPVAAPVSSCQTTFEVCESNSDCCSGLCEFRFLDSNVPRICRSAPKTTRMKLSGQTRGGAAAIAGANAVDNRSAAVVGDRKRRLVRGA